MANDIKNQERRVADRAADVLYIDREARRRAFYREPEGRVGEMIRWVSWPSGAFPGTIPRG